MARFVADWFEAREDQKYSILLSSLVLLVVLNPLINDRELGRYVWDFFLLYTLLAAVYVVRKKQRQFLLVLLIASSALVTNSLVHLGDSEIIPLIAFSFDVLFFGFMAVSILNEILSSDSITTDRLCGAVCVYFLIGVCWSFIYLIIEWCIPNSFSVPLDLVNLDDRESFKTIQYYSFVTLTTLGFGDIIPLSSEARTFSWLEAITGQLYLAVLIGRLIGLHISSGLRK